MLLFVDLAIRVRKDVVLDTYSIALANNGYKMSSFKYIDLLARNGYRTLVIGVDAPIEDTDKVINIGVQALRDMQVNITTNFRMYVQLEYGNTQAEQSLYAFAENKNDLNKNRPVNAIRVGRSFSQNGCLGMSVAVLNITEKVYINKDKLILDELKSIKGVKNIVIA